MSWKYDTVKIIYPGKAWSDDDGVQHPANWVNWSDSEKTANKVAWVDDTPASYDSRFYFNADNPKPLADLKADWIARKKKEANGLLHESDWYVVRKQEKGTAIPSETSTKRDAIRTACASVETKITDVADLDAFIALFQVKANGDPSDIDCYSEI